MQETIYDTISIEKYRKAVSLEAIAEKGYDAAVNMTDEEFKADLQAVVMDRFYAQLNAGTLTGNEATWQMAIAMAIAQVKDKFKKMHRTPTGVAVWVNTLDLYRYMGDKDITLQTAFGMNYIKDFLGADTVFVSSEIEAGKVIATPYNNLVAYYVNPGDSEFAKAGLSYTTDSETGFIGFHAMGAYDKALSENYAIMGIRLFAEYLDGIAVLTVDSGAAAAALNTGAEDKVYTEAELEALTVDKIKGLAAFRGYTITKTAKAEIIAEFLAQQNA